MHGPHQRVLAMVLLAAVPSKPAARAWLALLSLSA
jgi:hypothetical protein